MQQPRQESSECIICHKALEQPLVLGCQHTYCEKCISDWMNSGSPLSRMCPYCQKPINKPKVFEIKGDLNIIWTFLLSYDTNEYLWGGEFVFDQNCSQIYVLQLKDTINSDILKDLFPNCQIQPSEYPNLFEYMMAKQPQLSINDSF